MLKRYDFTKTTEDSYLLKHLVTEVSGPAEFVSKRGRGQKILSSSFFFFISIDVTKLFVFSYNLVFFLVTYLLPMVGMILCYLQMGLHLWQGDRETIGSVPQHPAMVKSRQNKKRVGSNTIVQLVPL